MRIKVASKSNNAYVMATAGPTVYLAADHGGWPKKNRLVSALQSSHRLIDLSARRPAATDDYPRWAAAAARAIQRHPQARAILLCRTGVGMALAANKFPGIRAVQAWSATVARRSRQDEDTNVLSLAADLHSSDTLVSIVRAWLKTPFRGAARHRRRLRQIQKFEHGR